MKVGFVGLGKLGLPVSVAMVQRGHEVFGYEVNVNKRENYRIGKANLYEPDINHKLGEAVRSGLHIVDSIKEIVKPSKIIFLAVQTPSKTDHSFDTSYLLQATEKIGFELRQCPDRKVIAVISTILPGTIRSQVAPVLRTSSQKNVGESIGLCYNASFIAMGRVIEDFYNPEFVLIGESDSDSGRLLEEFYESIVSKGIPILHMTWENAEIVKMAYNTMIGFKIVYANTLMELCHKLPGADIDVISNTLSKAYLRIASGLYLRGGMSDGGPCHPRDNLALSWLANKMDLSTDPFGYVMKARRAQCEWLANLLMSYQLPIVIMGIRFKPDTNLTDDSASLVVKDILVDKGCTVFMYDPMVQPVHPPDTPSVFLITLNEPFVKNFKYPEGSIVIDPWRCLDGVNLERENVKYVPIGKAKG